jgi:hypothetical protein
MWPFRSRRKAELWELMPARPGSEKGSLTHEQRQFIFWALATAREISRREAQEATRFYHGATQAGRQDMADFYLDSALGWNGMHVQRLIREPAYWEEYQRVMHGQRIDKMQYFVGRIIPTGDTSPWRIHPGRR